MKIQRSSFYNSFGSREGILATVLNRYMDASPLNQLVNDIQDKETSADIALIDLILDFSHFLANNGQGRGCLFFNGLSELSARDGQIYEIYQDYYLRLMGGLSQLLDRYKREISQSEGVNAISIDHFLCILMSLAHFSKLDPSELRLARIGLDQLSGVSPHFATLIKTQARSVETMRQSQEAQRLQA
jgi:AcrR family transcriptional regulator